MGQNFQRPSRACICLGTGDSSPVWFPDPRRPGLVKRTRNIPAGPLVPAGLVRRFSATVRRCLLRSAQLAVLAQFCGFDGSVVCPVQDGRDVCAALSLPVLGIQRRSSFRNTPVAILRRGQNLARPPPFAGSRRPPWRNTQKGVRPWKRRRGEALQCDPPWTYHR